MPAATQIERGYALRPRVESEEHFGVWRLSKVTEDSDAQFDWEADLMLRPRDPASSWPTPSAHWVSDSDEIGPRETFSFIDSHLVARPEDIANEIADLLAPCGEWLPLSGEAEGFSVYMPSRSIDLDEERTQYRGHQRIFYAAEILSFAEHDLPTEDACMTLFGIGTLWFESENRLRSAVARSASTGLGFTRYWDRTGTYRVPTKAALSEDPRWE